MSTTTATLYKLEHPPVTPFLKSSVIEPRPRKLQDGRLRLLIDGRWYDVTAWKSQHPGGSDILDALNGEDATDAFYSLHSKEATARLKRMHSVEASPNELKPSKLTVEFRKFRADLEKKGFFDRSFFWEAFYLLSIWTMSIVGTYFAFNGRPWLAMTLIGFAMQQAGWIGHDYVHGRGSYQFWAGRISSGCINAFSPTWWSNKHNHHHVYTNYIGLDEDIHNDPIFHLLFPHEHSDVWFRKFQHLYFVPVASFLFASWRMQSFQWALARGKSLELALMAVNYFWLYQLGLHVALGSVLLGGGLVAVIVTATHQSEDMIDASTPDKAISLPYSYVECQFNTTRDAITPDPFFHWLWGGMQYQLVHHLFPTMPKYRFAEVRPLLEKWAKENNIEYKCDTMWGLWKRNYETLKFFSQPTPDPKEITYDKRPQ